MAFEISGVVSFEGSGEKGGLDRANLLSAYKLPESGGSGQTVAIVDAYNDPNAESDLKKYREKYKLSECTESNKCFKKINQTGEAKSYPVSSASWTVEMSLDLDMVSAICPECHILLVEATSNTYSNMETAENEAAKWEEAETKKKATEISNSWGGPERSGETSENSAFEHPGIPILVAAGDYCYINECEGYAAPNFPAASPSVIAVGGTELKTASNSRGWSESVWDEPESEYGAIGTGSGCSLYESKPSWETGSSCSKRTENDIAAVGACKSPLSIYDSYEREGWFVECGTSAATPIVAGVEALSTSEAREKTDPNSLRNWRVKASSLT
jgi:subtilase family serine protease